MRIAQIAPLAESVPPKLYGGTERVVHYLTEELVRLGHQVTLFASGDSHTSARLVAGAPRALRLDPAVREPLPHLLLQLDRVRRRAHEFDVLHFHVDLVHFPLFRGLRGRTVTTLHGRLDLPDLAPFYAAFDDMPVVSISRHQASYLPRAHWAGTVYHGVPVQAYPYTGEPRDDYVAFIGRISPEKRPDRAIAIARRAGVRLRIAAKVDPVDEAYFRRTIAPLLAGPGVEFIGEIGEAEKPAFLGNARALLFPIDWPEPFGLVMIEAMACGTPVVAWRCGSVPEVVESGVTGYIVESEDEAVQALANIANIERETVRRRMEERFSAERMARDYLEIYRKLPDAAAAARRVANG